MKTILKIRKQEVGGYEKIIEIIEKIITRKSYCVRTKEINEELKELKQMQDFCYKQIEKFDERVSEVCRLLGKEDEWANEQCRLLGKDKK